MQELWSVALVTALPIFSLEWTAGNWFMLPELLAACAHAQGETAAKRSQQDWKRGSTYRKNWAMRSPWKDEWY